jgi:prevent-host-death family protein
MITTTVTASDVQRQIGTVLRRVGKDGEHLIIERGGIPIAVLVPYTDYKTTCSSQTLPASKQSPDGE